MGVEPICRVLSEHGTPIAPTPSTTPAVAPRRRSSGRGAEGRDRPGARGQLRRLRGAQRCSWRSTGRASRLPAARVERLMRELRPSCAAPNGSQQSHSSPEPQETPSEEPPPDDHAPTPVCRGQALLTRILNRSGSQDQEDRDGARPGSPDTSGWVIMPRRPWRCEGPRIGSGTGSRVRNGVGGGGRRPRSTRRSPTPALPWLPTSAGRGLRAAGSTKRLDHGVVDAGGDPAHRPEQAGLPVVGGRRSRTCTPPTSSTLKRELIYRRSWPTRHELEMEVFSYLEGFYNTRRRHSRLGNLSPTDYEQIHLTQKEVSA